MDWLDRLAELVPPADEVDDVSGACELAETFLGFGLPDEYVELSRRYGSGEFALVADDFFMFIRLLAVHEMFVEGPAWLGRDRFFRDAGGGERYRYAPADPEPRRPVTRLDTGLCADWPFWPEPSGAVPVADTNGSQMYLLQHLQPGRWRVGWALRDDGVVEADVGIAEWVHGWLTGRHPLDGVPVDDPRPVEAEVVFRPARHALVVARLEPSDSTLAHRRAALTRVSISPLRSPLATGLTESPSEHEPLAYAAAGWQRLDLDVARGDRGIVRCWYDDAVDASGNHRVGALVRSDRPEHQAVLEDLAAALESPIIEIDEL